MKITQITLDDVIKDPTNPTFFRISMSDDGNYGHSHTAVRIKPIKNCLVGELVPNSNYGYIKVEA